jgi:thiol-disulfide isomerase/thioredoxin
VTFRNWFLAALLLGGAVQADPVDFSLPDIEGKARTLSEFRGKWVVVNFWATWCPPCLEEIPDLIGLHDNKKNNLVVLGVAMDYQDPKQVVQFAEQQMISYPVILGSHDVAAQIGPINGLPTTYLYNPQGKMVAYNVGALSREAVEGYIATANKKKAAKAK